MEHICLRMVIYDRNTVVLARGMESTDDIENDRMEEGSLRLIAVNVNHSDTSRFGQTKKYDFCGFCYF